MSSSVEVKINPNVLVWARITAHYDIEEISNKMDLSLDRMRKWEEGRESPTYIQLLDLANYYQRPATLFFSPKVPETEPDLPQDFRTLPDSERKISPKVIFELRSARSRRDNLLSLEDYADYKFSKFNLNANLNDDIESLADKIKTSLGINWAKQDAIKNYDKVLEFYISKIEKLGVLVFQFYGIESKEMRGYALSYNKLPIIGINVKEHPHGKIFTLFHELVHLALNKEGISNIGSYKLENKIEYFCNKVAAEILVPKKQLCEINSVKRINDGTIEEHILKKLSKRFKVSPEVIIRSLLSINIISKSFFKQRKQMWNEYIAPNYRISKSVKKEDEDRSIIKKAEIITHRDPNVAKALKRNGIYYTEIVLEAYDNELITSSDLSDYIGEKLKTIDEIKRKLSVRESEK